MRNPLPNFHAARLRPPSKKRYTGYRTDKGKLGPGVNAILGLRRKTGPRGGVTELQSIHFDADVFSPAQAKRWLKQRKFTPILFEPAAVRRKNPESLAVLNAARQMRSDFMNDGRTVEDVEMTEIDIPDVPEAVILIGDYLRVDYGSDKFGDGYQHYYHESSAGGLVLFHPEGKWIMLLAPPDEPFEVGPRGLMN